MNDFFYFRKSKSTLFILPAIAVGVDSFGLPFLEIAWLCWAVGVGLIMESDDKIPSAIDYANANQMAVTKEWMAGWDACKKHVKN